MSVTYSITFPGMGQQQYDELSSAIEERLFADGVPEGYLLHIAGAADGGWRMVDVWESRDLADSFYRHVAQLIAEVEAPAPLPAEVWDIHYLRSSLPAS